MDRHFIRQSDPHEAGEAAGTQASRSSHRTGRRCLRRRNRRIQWLLASGTALGKYLSGVLFCLSIPTSFLVIGWSLRLSQRYALKYLWWTHSKAWKTAPNFRTWVSRSAQLGAYRRWPNWIVQQNGAAVAKTISRDTNRRGWNLFRAYLKLAFHSLWKNLTRGLGGAVNTWVFTLPAGVVWLFSWYSGWDNSFNKGYEQAAVGPVAGFAGIGLFIAAMSYVPMAQARQAVTGQWKTFYHFKRVWAVIRLRWFSSLMLAVGYSLLALPLMVAGSFLGLSTSGNSELANLSPPAALEFLRIFFFVACFFVFPAYAVLRVFAGMVYASATLELVRAGKLDAEDLSPFERISFHELDLFRPRPGRRWPVPVRVLAWTTSRSGMIGAGVLAAMLWFIFASQIYITQFFNAQPYARWLNHPLIQLPWYQHIPGHLKDAADDYERFTTADNR